MRKTSREKGYLTTKLRKPTFNRKKINELFDPGLQNAALGLRPRAAFLRPRSQFFTIEGREGVKWELGFAFFRGWEMGFCALGLGFMKKKKKQ